MLANKKNNCDAAVNGTPNDNSTRRTTVETSTTAVIDGGYSGQLLDSDQDTEQTMVPTSTNKQNKMKKDEAVKTKAEKTRTKAQEQQDLSPSRKSHTFSDPVNPTINESGTFVILRKQVISFCQVMGCREPWEQVLGAHCEKLSWNIFLKCKRHAQEFHCTCKITFTSPEYRSGPQVEIKLDNSKEHKPNTNKTEELRVYKLPGSVGPDKNFEDNDFEPKLPESNNVTKKILELLGEIQKSCDNN